MEKTGKGIKIIYLVALVASVSLFPGCLGGSGQGGGGAGGGGGLFLGSGGGGSYRAGGGGWSCRRAKWSYFPRHRQPPAQDPEYSKSIAGGCYTNTKTLDYRANGQTSVQNVGTHLAQSFTLPQRKRVVKIGIELLRDRNTSASGYVMAELRRSTNSGCGLALSCPSNDSVATSVKISATRIPTSSSGIFTVFTFYYPPTLNAGEKYWVVVHGDHTPAKLQAVSTTNNGFNLNGSTVLGSADEKLWILQPSDLSFEVRTCND